MRPNIINKIPQKLNSNITNYCGICGIFYFIYMCIKVHVFCKPRNVGKYMYFARDLKVTLYSRSLVSALYAGAKALCRSCKMS